MNGEEKLIFALRSIYESHGYRPYRMGKFEEYDLYANNRDFLISDNVITFTDKSGRLLALKPDVTLSIVKNTLGAETEGVQRLCYNENVYRPAKDGSFREIMQTGVECIGSIDDYCIGETLCLAAESLDTVSHDFILEISHLGLLSAAVRYLGLSEKDSAAVMRCAGMKNIHEIKEICAERGVTEDKTKLICELVSLFGRPTDTIGDVVRIAEAISARGAADELCSAIRMLETSPYSDNVRIDFSVGGDVNYYNGIVFKGYINGISESVLSGGRYDGLLRKLGKTCGAVGFAVYLNTLESLTREGLGANVDALLLYGEDDDPALVASEAARLRADGSSVIAARSVDKNMRYGRIVRFGADEVTGA